MNDKNLEELNRLKNTLETELKTETVSLEESSAGKYLSELQKLRQDFDSYVRKQEAEQKAQEERKRVERKRNLIISLLAGSFTGVVSGLILYYWPAITARLFSLAQ